MKFFSSPTCAKLNPMLLFNMLIDTLCTIRQLVVSADTVESELTFSIGRRSHDGTQQGAD